MTETWLPFYEHTPMTSCTGPGSFVAGYPPRHVWHTTEGNDLAVALGIFARNNCYAPHFVLDIAHARYIQLAPLEWATAALQHTGAAGVETNRAHAIQTEVIGFAREAPDWDDHRLEVLGWHLANIIAGGVPIDLQRTPPVFTDANHVHRLSADEWHLFAGDCGHQHVPDQPDGHWDPGALNIGAVHDHARQYLNLHPTPEEPEVITEQDTQAIAKLSAEWSADQVLEALAMPGGDPSPRGVLVDKFRNEIARSVAYLESGDAKAQGQPFAQDAAEPNLGTLEHELEGKLPPPPATPETPAPASAPPA